jgi:hypothetical protein
LNNDEDDEKLQLRDKIVLSLLTGSLDGNNKYTGSIKDALLHPEANVDTKRTRLSIENRIRAAYKMADLIRKIRLESFS